MKRFYKLENNSETGEGAAIDFSAALNGQQLAATTHLGGPALVIAGAGSGKTRTLTYRVAWLLAQGVPAYSILLLTFTNKAAREMLGRVEGLVPSSVSGMWSGTFHSIGNRILRSHAEKIGYRRGFTILDSEDSEAMIHAVVKREGLTDKRFPKSSVLADIFGFSANTGKSIREVLGSKYHYFIPIAEVIERLNIAYELDKRKANVMDFDDLLTKTHLLFIEHPAVLAAYRKQFCHVLVDEYQDTSYIQAEFAEMIAAGEGNLTVVGDDAQSIYSWRGAHFANILDFPKRHPQATIYKIETNYRSVPQVLDVANAVIEHNTRQFRKVLDASRGAATRPTLVALPDTNQQAAFIAQRILEIEREGGNFEDIAILYRAHFHSMEIQMELTRRGIPFVITSGLRFFEQAHVKDIAAFLKFVVNPRDGTAFKRCVRLLPGIGEKTADQIWYRVDEVLKWAEGGFAVLHKVAVPKKADKPWQQFVNTLEEMTPKGVMRPPAEMLDCALQAIYDALMREKFPNYDSRKEDITMFIGYAQQFPGAEEFLTQVSLMSGVEDRENVSRSESTAGKVVLSTVHQAKGLEWKSVFLINLAEGMFPHSRASENPEALEEERRLFYVGVTRCKDHLYLTLPHVRLGREGAEYQSPSRFLHEIPDHLLDVWEVGDQTTILNSTKNFHNDNAPF